MRLYLYLINKELYQLVYATLLGWYQATLSLVLFCIRKNFVRKFSLSILRCFLFLVYWSSIYFSQIRFVWYSEELISVLLALMKFKSPSLFRSASPEAAVFSPGIGISTVILFKGLGFEICLIDVLEAGHWLWFSIHVEINWVSFNMLFQHVFLVSRLLIFNLFQPN